MTEKAVGTSIESKSPTVLGVDVSHWQGQIDWITVHAFGVNWAMIKATEGVTGIDELCAFNICQARAAGIAHVGVFHVITIGDGPHDVAKEVFHHLDTRWLLAAYHHNGTNMPSALDVETSQIDEAPLLAPSEIWQWVDTYAQRIGHYPYLYCSERGVRHTTIEARDIWMRIAEWCPLWLMGRVPGPLVIPYPWAEQDKSWSVLQHRKSSRGEVPGIEGEVDLDLVKMPLEVSYYAQP